MKKIVYGSWKKVPNSESLKYFAQLVQDMLFDFNHSSYKVKILNTHFLCEEFLSFYPLIKKGTISENAHKAIIEELILSWQYDSVAKDIFGDLKEKYLSEINESLDDIDKLYRVVKVIKEVLDHRYYKALSMELTDLIVNNKNEKKKIRSVTQSLLSELINGGYSKRYIFGVNNELFFNSLHKIQSTEIISSFFDKFEFIEKNYSVLFRLKKQEIIFKIFEKTNFKVHKSLPSEYSRYPNFDDGDYMYIELPEIITLDPFSAKEHAEYLISIFESFIKYNHHKIDIQIEKRALVLDKKINWCFLINEETPNILKQPDKKQTFITEDTQKTFSILMELDRGELLSALRAHADAIRTNNVNHQFVTLWTAIESLSGLVGNDKNINNIIKKIEPVFILNYFSRYLRHLHRNILREHGDDYLNLIRKEEYGKNDFEKAVLFLALKNKNEPLREEFYSMVKDTNPLAVNQIHHMMKMLNNVDSLNDGLERYLNNVRWQLKRIYRTRNMIVHSNVQPSYLNSLIENLHEYYDKLVETIIKTSETYPSIKDLDGIMFKIKILAEHHQKNLKENKGLEINKDNFRKFILHEF